MRSKRTRRSSDEVKQRKILNERDSQSSKPKKRRRIRAFPTSSDEEDVKRVNSSSDEKLQSLRSKRNNRNLSSSDEGGEEQQSILKDEKLGQPSKNKKHDRVIDYSTSSDEGELKAKNSSGKKKSKFY